MLQRRPPATSRSIEAIVGDRAVYGDDHDRIASENEPASLEGEPFCSGEA